MKHTMKRVISLWAALFMLFNVLPISVIADDGDLEEIVPPYTGTLATPFAIVLNFDEPPRPIPQADCFAVIKANYGNALYVVPLSWNGEQNQVVLETGGTWVQSWGGYVNFDPSWEISDITIIKANPGANIQTGPNVPQDGSYTVVNEVHGLVPVVNPTLYTSSNGYKYAVLQMKKHEIGHSAITPREILGSAVEYGIVADKLRQKGHTETNFAVNEFYYLDHSTANIDIDGSGTGAMPFYIGKITDTFKLTSGTITPIDLFITQDDVSKIDVNGSSATVTPYIRTAEQISTVVSGMISAGKTKSQDLAKKTTIAPGSLNNKAKDIDTTGFGPNDTIYIDCSNVNISTGGWTITKLPNQSIVFNVPDKNAVIGEFYVNGLKSTTTANNGDPVANQNVYNTIIKHITFNCYNRVTQKNGAGWILAAGEVQSDAEWHYYVHERYYEAEGVLKGTKSYKVNDRPSNPAGFNFKVERISGAENGIVDGTDIAGTYSSDSNGTINFGNIKFNKAGTWVYEVSETTTSSSWFADYDTSKYRVTFNVVSIGDDENGPFTVERTIRKLERRSLGLIYYYHDAGSVESIVFNNTEDTRYSGQAVLKAKKAGDPKLGERTFQFQMLDANNNVIETSGPIKQNQEVTFTAIPYTQDDVYKTYTYKIKEVIPEGAVPIGNDKYELDGVTYDGHVETVEVSVSYGTGGNLSIKYNGKNNFTTPVFTNSYNATGSAVMSAKKTADSSLGDRTFQFQLINPDGTVRQTSNGVLQGETVTFDAISYTLSDAGKSFDYQIKEVIPQGATPLGNDKYILNGVTYDGHAETITIRVFDGGNGSLLITYNNSTTFTNTYSAEGEKELEATKSINDWGEAESFTFTLAPVNGAPMPTGVDTNGNVVKTVTKDNLVAKFGTIKYTAAGTYKYTITETDDGVAGITYDTEAHEVVVTVVDNHDGTLTATAKYAELHRRQGDRRDHERVQRRRQGRIRSDKDHQQLGQGHRLRVHTEGCRRSEHARQRGRREEDRDAG